MRYFATLLACTLVSCSSNSSADDGYKPALTPLGTAADKAQPLPASPAPRPASATNPPHAASSPAWPAPFEPASGGCNQVAAHGAVIRMRPAADAAQFGQLSPGDRVQLVARTAGGWVGFNPGSAQAANVGIFRLRWVLAAEAFDPGSACKQLPLVQAPPAGCLLMAARPVPVRRQPAAGATLLSTVPMSSYARVVSAPGSAGQWVEILVPGRTEHGFVAASDASFTRPCQ